ncbi:MAG: hypothetical protein D1H97_03610 [Paracoccus sp. BP8]|nr:MAG: hypothetical protein D1H97_03610 [Paracoccus sp. BP8]
MMLLPNETPLEYEADRFTDGLGSRKELDRSARDVIEGGDKTAPAGDNLELSLAKITGLPRRELTAYQAAEVILAYLAANYPADDEQAA